MYNTTASFSALIVAAGCGTRFGGVLPKQYAPLAGKPLLLWSIEALLHHPRISQVCVAIHPDHLHFYAEAVKGLDLPPPLIGGNTRQDTVRRALADINGDYVLIHDAARPCLQENLISALCAAAAEDSAVVPALPVSDTVRRVTAEKTVTESREGLYAIQTPQVFHTTTIRALHLKHTGESFTDDAALYESSGMNVKLVTGQRENIKITHTEDMAAAEKFLSAHARLGGIEAFRKEQGHK